MQPAPPHAQTPWDASGTQKQDGDVVDPIRRNLAGINNTRVVFVDSRVRNVGAHPQASDFVFRFGKNIRNVTEIRLMSTIIPIVDATVHVFPAGYEPNPFVILQVEATGSSTKSAVLEGVRGETTSSASDMNTENYIADSDGMLMIPLTNYGTTTPVGGNTANYATWNERANHPASIQFKPPVQTMTGLHLRLANWSSSTDTNGRGAHVTYPLDVETAPASETVASGLEPHNNVQYVFEIVSHA